MVASRLRHGDVVAFGTYVARVIGTPEVIQGQVVATLKDRDGLWKCAYRPDASVNVVLRDTESDFRFIG